MGALSIYLLPEGEIDPAAYGKAVKKVLLAMNVIENENYEEPNWWVAGSLSGGIFEGGSTDEPGFEYCILNASKHFEVVPQDPAEFPSCPTCGESVSDGFYDTVNDIQEEFEEKPAKRAAALTAARVGCPGCKGQFKLTELKAAVGIFLSGTWVNFEDPPGSLRAEWLAVFNRETGIRHRCLEYWYT